MKPPIITDHLPESVEIAGVIYQVGWGWREVMGIEINMFDENVSPEQRLLNALNLFYHNNIPPDLDKAVEEMLWFHRCGRKEKTEATSAKRVRRGYDFVEDDGLIYSAFRQQYGMDLRRTKNAELHWWEFRAMFETLEESTRMARVMYWRVCDETKLSKSEKKFVLKMRHEYALREPEQDLDSKARLLRRNERMKEYVRKRQEECRKGRK